MKTWLMRFGVIGAIVAVVVGAFLFFGESSARSPSCAGASTAPDGTKQLGECAVYDQNGKVVWFSDFEGKHLFLNFWASWCPACRSEMPAMERLWQERKNTGFAMLALSTPSVSGSGAKETEAAAKGFFFIQHDFTYRFAYDRDDSIRAAYSIPNIPTTYLVNPDGSIADVIIGARRWDSANCRKFLDTWIAGKEITRGLRNGCR